MKTLDSFVKNSPPTPAPAALEEIVTPYPFPEEIEVKSPFAAAGTYRLFHKTPRTAFYFKHSYCQGDALEIKEIIPDVTPNRHVIMVQHMITTMVMGTKIDIDDPCQLNWLACRADYFARFDRAFDSLAGKEEVPKGKRKPEPIKGMDRDELAAFLGVPTIPGTGGGRTVNTIVTERKPKSINREHAFKRQTHPSVYFMLAKIEKAMATHQQYRDSDPEYDGRSIESLQNDLDRAKMGITDGRVSVYRDTTFQVEFEKVGTSIYAIVYLMDGTAISAFTSAPVKSMTIVLNQIAAIEKMYPLPPKRDEWLRLPKECLKEICGLFDEANRTATGRTDLYR